MKWQRYGPHALLCQFAEGLGDETFARGCAIAKHLEENPPEGLLEFVSGFTTVLLEFDPRAVPNVEEIAPGLASTLETAGNVRRPAAPVKEIPITYNGPDLETVAVRSGLTVPEVVRLHAAPIYKVYCLGFAPGFPYLGDLDSRLHTPRLAAPRSRVAPGAVGIGGQHTGIYSVESPGGWNIIGYTTVKLFDPSDESGTSGMFYLRQGDRVKFVP